MWLSRSFWVVMLLIAVSQQWLKNVEPRPAPTGDRPGAQERLSAPAKPSDDPLWAAMNDLLPASNSSFQLDQHFVETSDGYVLRVFRLGLQVDASHAVEASDQLRRPVVLLQHALMDSSAGWLLMGPEKSLGFILAQEGFDVWMGNVRGNRFARNHTTLDPDKDAAFWSFSWDQHASEDLPAIVKFILDATQAPDLQYVGYSQGTTMALAGLSSHPFLQQSISFAALMAPVCFVGHMTSLLFRSMAQLNTAKLFETFGVKEFGAHDPTSSQYFARVCGMFSTPCVKWLQFLCGTNPKGNLDAQVVSSLLKYMPAGTSTQNMAHWGQMVRKPGAGPSGLQMYDYGVTCPLAASNDKPASSCNQQEYGQLEPPSYNLSRIATPLALFSGGMDSLSVPQDVQLLLAALPPRVLLQHHHIPEYAHLDFGLGTDAHQVLYPSMVRVLKQQLQAAAGRRTPGRTAAAAA